MDTNLLKLLQLCPLFFGMVETEIESALSTVKYHIIHFDEKDMYALAGYSCHYADIILKGEMITHMVGPSGKYIKIATLIVGNMVAPAFIFAKDNAIPVSVDAGTKVDVLRMSRNDFHDLVNSNEKIRWNFIEMLSNINAFLTSKMRTLSLLSVREKIANMLLEISREQGSHTFTLNISRQEIADAFGIQKFSVIRQLTEFQKEGAIKIEGKVITILNPLLLRVHP